MVRRQVESKLMIEKAAESKCTKMPTFCVHRCSETGKYRPTLSVASKNHLNPSLTWMRMSALPVSSSDPMPAFRIPCQQWSGAPLVNQQQSLAMQLLVGQITAQICIAPYASHFYGRRSTMIVMNVMWATRFNRGVQNCSGCSRCCSC